MKIEKTKLKYFTLSSGNNDHTLSFNTDNEGDYGFLDLAILSMEKNKITIGTKTSPQQACDIIIDSTYLLKLLTHYVGQEKHVHEELTSLRKKVEALNSPIIHDVVDSQTTNPQFITSDSPRTNKDIDNQHKLNQIRDELVDCECGNMTFDEAYKKIQDIVSISYNI